MSRLKRIFWKAKEAAEESVRAKAAFLANMSHELRTPLNAVIGFSSLLLDDNLTQEQKGDIESIRNGGEALLALIDDILEFSRLKRRRWSWSLSRSVSSTVSRSHSTWWYSKPAKKS